MYDPDRIGPNWNFAIDHGKACMPGRTVNEVSIICQQINSLGNKNKISGICECCLNVIDKQPLPLCQNSKQLQFLGFGFPLYFIFLKYAIILILIQIISYSVLSINWGIKSTKDICFEGATRQLHDGSEVVCSSWLIIFMRSQLEVQSEQIILRLVSFCIQLLGLVYIRDMLRKTNNYYDQRTTSLSDYSLIFINIPKCPATGGIQSIIHNFLEKGFGTKTIKVEEIVLLNELQNFYDLRNQKRQLIKVKQKLLRQKNQFELTVRWQRQFKKIETLLTEIDSSIKKQYENELQLTKQDKVICEKAILIMESQDVKDSFQQQFQKIDQSILRQYFGEGGQNIELVQAPEPKQIMWENINYPANKKILRLFMGWALAALFLALVTGVFFGIIYSKSHKVELMLQQIAANPDDPHNSTLQMQALAFTLLSMLAIILFNKFLLSPVMHWLTDLQRHSTSSQYQFSFGLKYTLCLFFTTAVMTLLVQAVTLKNIYKQRYGVVEQQSIMFFFNSFLVPLIWLINPWHIFHIIKRKLNFGDKYLTQQQANNLMQESKYSMGKKYAQIIESIWFTYLYSSLIPAGSILIIIGFSLFYWIDKYNLLRKSSINQNVNSQLCIKTIKLLDASLLFRSIGQIIFDSMIRDGACWQSIICLCIAVLYLFLPMNSILQHFHEQKFKAEEKKYAEVKERFIQNYRTMHPLHANERYSFIESMKLIQQQKIDGLKFQTHRSLLNISGPIPFNETQKQMIRTRLNLQNMRILYESISD